MKNKLLEFLKKHKVMALGTQGETPWLCWVFFMIDEDLNFYFVSGNSKHVDDMLKNNAVSFGISESSQRPGDVLQGLQAHGTVEQVKGPDQLKWFFKMWKNLINKNEEKLTYKNYLDKAISSKVYKITPEKIQWFNKEFDPPIQNIKL